MSDERVDAVIDEVARQMSEASPADADAFRRRVLARIDNGGAPRRSWRASLVLTPIAAAAAIAMAMLARREPKNVTPAPDILHTARTEPAGRVTAEPPARKPGTIGPGATGPGVHDRRRGDRDGQEVARRTAGRIVAPR